MPSPVGCPSSGCSRTPPPPTCGLPSDDVGHSGLMPGIDLTFPFHCINQANTHKKDHKSRARPTQQTKKTGPTNTPQLDIYASFLCVVSPCHLATVYCRQSCGKYIYALIQFAHVRQNLLGSQPLHTDAGRAPQITRSSLYTLPFRERTEIQAYAPVQKVPGDWILLCPLLAGLRVAILL